MEWDSSVQEHDATLKFGGYIRDPRLGPVNRSPARTLPVKTGSTEYFAIQSLEIFFRRSIHCW